MKIKKIVKIITGIMGFISLLLIIIEIILFLDDVGLLNLGSNRNALEKVTGSAASNNEELEGVMAATDEEVWSGLTDGLLSQRPTDANPSNSDEIKKKVKSQIVPLTITVNQKRKAEGNSDNLVDQTAELTIEVNKYLKDFWEDFFNELKERYWQDCELSIESVTCYSLDSRENGKEGLKSAHAYGAAVDINASYNKKVYTQKEYDALDTSNDPLLKKRIIYSDSKIVEIAHKYSLLWGGEWESNKKSTMHFSFIGDRNFQS